MKKLVYYGGDGFENSPENGKFQVRIDGKIKEFTKLSEARKYYKKLKVSKAIWDITIIPELIECHFEE